MTGIETVFYLESLRENGLASQTADESGDSVAQNHSSTKRKRRPKNKNRKDPSQATMAAMREHAAKEKDKKAGS